MHAVSVVAGERGATGAAVREAENDFVFVWTGFFSLSLCCSHASNSFFKYNIQHYSQELTPPEPLEGIGLSAIQPFSSPRPFPTAVCLQHVNWAAL